MGNICEIISRPFKNEPIVVVGTPISQYDSPPIIVYQQQYHAPGLSAENGFLTGVLIGEILD